VVHVVRLVEYLPAVHGVQFAAPLPDIDPSAQSEQIAVPSVLAYVPDSQFKQVIPLLVYVPVGQSLQDVLLGPEKVPDVHT
jgi:hypothetical protein